MKSSNWDPLSPDWDPLTPGRFLFTLAYSAIFFSIWVGIPYFVIGWVIGKPAPEWFTALLVIASFPVFGPFCRRMRVWFRPWQKFHTWAYKKPPTQ